MFYMKFTLLIVLLSKYLKSSCFNNRNIGGIKERIKKMTRRRKKKVRRKYKTVTMIDDKKACFEEDKILKKGYL